MALHRSSVAQALTLPFAERRAHWTLLSRYLSFHVGELRSLLCLPRTAASA